MKAMGIVFSNSHEVNLPELTSDRSIAAVPFAGRFRLIDMVLSGMANAEIYKVAVIAERNYHSLVKHIGAGKDWDLVRKNSGLTVFTPFGSVGQTRMSSCRIEALECLLSYLKESAEKLVVISDSDIVGNIRYDAIIDFHVKNKADVTAAYRYLPIGNKQPFARKLPKELSVTNEGRITKICRGMRSDWPKNILMNIWVIDRELLISLIKEGITNGYRSFSADLLAAHTDDLRLMAYRHEGFYGEMTSLAAYLQHNLAFLNQDNLREVFGDEHRPVYTHVKDSPPTVYGQNSRVVNSLIASGCVIKGCVENSVLFRGVEIAEGAVVRNSVLMSDSFIAGGAELDYIVADKGATVREGRKIAGVPELPFLLPRNAKI
ncbi:MAG: glucose-1-phosphate adenylyltransferase subunit GlgD [Clostridia bacterium]|nr:glucose-1-phosphate adenylyltransferase subunit GlgD [Clostridia bacterium]MDD4798830.1 glucose-1-phosphate adenylyltransferase subunit GlgD [Clostridia bacterium]